jgi:hypothetical protein
MESTFPPKSPYSTLDRPTSDGCRVVESARCTVLMSPIVPQWNLYRTEMLKQNQHVHTLNRVCWDDTILSYKVKVKQNKPRYMMVINRQVSIDMTKCLGPHHDFDDFTTYDLTTFTTSRLLTDLESHFCTVNPVFISITSRDVVPGTLL